MNTTITPALAAGTWTGDSVHSDISFKVRHMGVGRVRGTFALTSATLTVADDGAAGRVDAVLDAASVRTGNDQRDQHVRAGDFLDVERFPAIEFASTGIRDFDGEQFVLVGDLTVHGVTRTVELDSDFFGVTDDPSGTRRTGFSATTRLSRAAFGVDIQLGFGAGNLVVADAIEIAVEIEFTSEGGESR
jgi:polyisoprenoid-binding protein YceI